MKRFFKTLVKVWDLLDDGKGSFFWLSVPFHLIWLAASIKFHVESNHWFWQGFWLFIGISEGFYLGRLIYNRLSGIPDDDEDEDY